MVICGGDMSLWFLAFTIFCLVATLYLQTRRLIDAYEKIWDLQAELNRLKRQNRHAPVCSGGINVHRYDPATSSGPESVDGIDRNAD